MTKAEIEKQKSLALAELVNFKLNGFPLWITGSELRMQSNPKIAFNWDPEFNPYSETTDGLAQFAAILLKYLQDEYMPPLLMCEPSQANILDEILHNRGKWQEEWDD